MNTTVAPIVTVAQALQDLIEAVQSLEPEKPKAAAFEASLQPGAASAGRTGPMG